MDDGSFDSIREELDSGRPWEPPQPGRQQPGSRFQFIPFDRAQGIPERRHLIKNLVPRVGLTVIWGPPKCGKSFLTSDLALHVALGWEYRGRRVEQGPVIYCALEGAAGFQARLAAFRQRFLAEHSEPVPFHLMPSRLDLVVDAPALIEAIRVNFPEVHPVLIVVDTLNRSFRGSESSDEDMTGYIRAADALRDAFECAIVVVHHCGHDEKRPRGHSALFGAVDAQIAVKKAEDGTIGATLEFMKDGPEGAEIGSRLDVIEVGADEDGDPITSCVVVPAEPAAKVPGLSAKERRAIEILRDCLVDQGRTVRNQRDIPNVTLVELTAWREALRRRGVTDGDKPANERSQFRRLQESLDTKGFIRVLDGLVWEARRP